MLFLKIVSCGIGVAFILSTIVYGLATGLQKYTDKKYNNKKPGLTVLQRSFLNDLDVLDSSKGDERIQQYDKMISFYRYIHKWNICDLHSCLDHTSYSKYMLGKLVLKRLENE